MVARLSRERSQMPPLASQSYQWRPPRAFSVGTLSRGKAEGEWFEVTEESSAEG